MPVTSHTYHNGSSGPTGDASSPLLNQCSQFSTVSRPPAWSRSINKVAYTQVTTHLFNSPPLNGLRQCCNNAGSVSTPVNNHPPESSRASSAHRHGHRPVQCPGRLSQSPTRHTVGIRRRVVCRQPFTAGFTPGNNNHALHLHCPSWHPVGSGFNQSREALPAGRHGRYQSTITGLLPPPPNAWGSPITFARQHARSNVARLVTRLLMPVK